MKQFLLLTTIALISISSFSQLNKNQFLVGGNISFSSATYGDEDTYKSKSETLQLSPGVGYFLFDKLAVGTKTEFSFNNSTVYYEDVLKSRSNSITLSPFVRYYILPKDKKLNVFAEVDYSYVQTTQRLLNAGYESKLKGNGYTVLGGPVYFINPYIALELTLSYNSLKYSSDTYRTNTFMTGLGFQIHLGNKKSKS